MTYKEFQEYVRTKCVYTAIYNDSEGREILVIPMLDASAMVNDAPKREWVGLTDDEIEHLRNDQPWWMVRDIEAKLKEKNGG
jgi:hypothetical protein